MNRAWIPAGALASVSVAGLIALGPLTDSMGTQVAFPASVPVTTGPSKSSVPVNFSRAGASGTTVTAHLVASQGGRKNPLAPTTGSDTGYTAYKREPGTAASAPAPATPKAEAPVKKKVVKRQNSIEAIGESNSDAGLAGGSSGKSDLGEQAATPSSDGG
jgi:hypothetical protein